ncbi:MAG TPA: ketoacyl-ACP synthase III, partial [Polyangiaceae bacterium LLY-WYZ-15_(1-7)]|nr:ketoacyl-ACP synthase III [Polyangiaceae bacterium LLY-WYZ-15_(1-7)]
MTRHAAIVSTGIHVPELEVDNDVLRRRFAKSAPDFVDRIEPKSGIRRRWYAPEGQATSDLAAAAGRRALARAGVAPEEVDLILVGTDSPDYITPSTSVVVQEKLGAERAGTFDVGCACASFPTALATAAGLIATQPHLKNVLVIGAYMMRKLADPADPMIFLYGDGAGAALVQPSEEPGLLQAAFRADGALAQDWFIAAGGTAEPANHDAIEAGRHFVKMHQKYPPAVNDEGWPLLARQLADRNGFALHEVDDFIFTQVRRRTIEKVMGFLEQPMEKATLVMDKWGYTGSACIPMALHDALARERVGPGSLVVLVGSGVGFNQAAIALRLTDAIVRPVPGEDEEG